MASGSGSTPAETSAIERNCIANERCDHSADLVLLDVGMLEGVIQPIGIILDGRLRAPTSFTLPLMLRNHIRVAVRTLPLTNGSQKLRTALANPVNSMGQE